MAVSTGKFEGTLGRTGYQRVQLCLHRQNGLAPGRNLLAQPPECSAERLGVSVQGGQEPFDVAHCHARLAQEPHQPQALQREPIEMLVAARRAQRRIRPPAL